VPANTFSQYSRCAKYATVSFWISVVSVFVFIRVLPLSKISIPTKSASRCSLTVTGLGFSLFTKYSGTIVNSIYRLSVDCDDDELEDVTSAAVELDDCSSVDDDDPSVTLLCDELELLLELELLERVQIEDELELVTLATVELDELLEVV
jgi:hypothetical protein